MLVHTDVTRYLEFKQIAGSYVYRDGRISKVPSTEMEAVRSPLMGLFEKRRARNFFMFLQSWREDDPATHQGEWDVYAALRGEQSGDQVLGANREAPDVWVWFRRFLTSLVWAWSWS
jgi:RAB protein geranylgeranyltransferase component A